MMRCVPGIAALVVVCALEVTAQSNALHTELEWRTIETEHFLVHAHEGALRTATAVAAVAESVYAPVTGLYGHEPDQKVSIVVRDHDDYSNGAAYFFDNRIEIWAPAMDFELRGIHPWIRNVVTHEFVHIVQLQTAMKLGRRFPALYLQWFGYESERRPDVLYGYPNVLVSYPLSFFLVPSWFAEGIAQYNHPALTWDSWDTHRDMVLRMAVLEDRLLSWEEMAVFGKTSLGNESSYNAGYSIVRHIAETYGVDKLVEISRALSSIARITIDGAIKEVLGRSGEELYAEWKSAMAARYAQMRRSIGEVREGTPVVEGGFGDFYPSFHPDGRSFFYISNKGMDYFGQSAIYRYDPDRDAPTRLVEGVRSTVSVTPDGRTLVYAKITSDNPHWSRWSDLYTLDLGSQEETRITYGLRAFNPRVSPDGKQIVFAYGSDGTLNIGTCNLDGTDIRRLTEVPAGHQVYTPVWSPDGSTIAFGYSRGHGQAIATVDARGGDIRIVADTGDCRTPSYAPDGRLYFSSDRTGIFNIYSLDPRTGDLRRHTNVVGGAFLPSVNQEGTLLYASYSSSGYSIRRLEHADPVPMASADDAPLSGNSVVPELLVGTSSADSLPGRSYRNTFTSLSIFPVLRFDNYNPLNSGLDILKPGLYVSSTDMLDKLTLFAGGVVNRRWERDLALIFEYRDKLPLFAALGLEPVLGLELYNISRSTSATILLEGNPPTPVTTDVTYNLFEFSVSLRQPVFQERTQLKAWFTLGRYNANIGAFVEPGPPPRLNPAFRHTYFIGNTFGAELVGDYRVPSVDQEINPTGRSVILRYAYENDQFNPTYDVSSGIAVPIYQKFRFHRAEVVWNEHIALPFERHTLSLSLRAAGVIGKTVDSFFDMYAGGLTGMRGYPFYSLGGNTAASATLTYRFPISRSLDMRILQIYFKKLFVSGFVDVGNAWTGRVPAMRDWKSDAGFELRLEGFSFYAFPTRFFFSGAYGFDEFQRTFEGVTVRYGREWRWYFGILFGFDLGQLVPSSLRQPVRGLR